LYIDYRGLPMGFVQVEKRGKNAQFFYYCSYNPATRNVKKIYLGRASDEEVERRVNFIQWLIKLSEEDVERLKREAEADEKLKVPFVMAFEDLLELEGSLKKAKVSYG